MTTEAQKTELLEDFQKYLEQSHPEPFASGEQPDLNTLLSELTGLKTEVKAESRQFKNTNAWGSCLFQFSIQIWLAMRALGAPLPRFCSEFHCAPFWCQKPCRWPGPGPGPMRMLGTASDD